MVSDGNDVAGGAGLIPAETAMAMLRGKSEGAMFLSGNDVADETGMIPAETAMAMLLGERSSVWLPKEDVVTLPRAGEEMYLPRG